MSVKNRVREFVKYENMTISAFETKINASNGYVNSISKSIGLDKIENILENFPNLNLEWLLTGRGTMIKNDYLDSELSVQEISSIYGDRQIKILSNNGKKGDKLYEAQEVPLYNIEVAAGLRDILDNSKAQQVLDTIRIPGLPKCDGALPATGDSMYPVLKAGDLVCFRQTSLDSVFWGEMYILDLQIDEWDSLLTVKYIQKSDLGDDYVKLVSQNQHHQPKDVRKEQIRAIASVKATIRINSMV